MSRPLGFYLYRLTCRLLARILGPVREAHGRLWLRLLSEKSIVALTVDGYRRAGFDDADFNRGGLWPHEEQAFRELFGGTRSIVVASAGGGREMLALARLGHRVAGFDPSPVLVEAGRSILAAEGIDAQLSLAEPGQVPRDLGRFDALVIGRGAYHHIYGRAARIDFLKQCLELVRPGAPMALGDVALRKPRQAPDVLLVAYMRRFEPSELESELAEGGWAGIVLSAVAGESLIRGQAIRA